jgi:hypothetical protein
MNNEPQLLFVYALLKRGYYEPKTLKPAYKAKIHADLYDLAGKDAAVKNVGNTLAVADGDVLTMPMDELLKIDKEEAPQFQRVKTKTLSGESVWVYKYLPEVPKGDKEVVDWHRTKKAITK